MPFASLFLLTFFFLSFLVRSTRSKNVTVLLNDSRVTTSPPNLWGAKEAYNTLSSCSGGSWLNDTGQAVVFLFTGTAVTLTFYPHVNGSIASVAIDGKDVAIVDTLSTEECQHSAKSMFWTADALAATSHNISVTIRSPRSQKWVAIGPFMYAALDDPSSTLSPFQYKAPDTGTIVGAVLGGVTTVAFVVLGVVFIILRRRMRLNMPVLSTLGDDTLVTTQTQTMTLGTLQFSKRGRQDTSTVREDSTSKRLPPRAPRVDKAVGPDVDEGGGVNLYNKKPSRLKRGVTESGGLNLSRKPSKVGIAQTEEPPQLPPLPGAGSPLPSPTTAAFAVASKGTEGHENAPGASRNEPHGEAEGITEVKRT